MVTRYRDAKAATQVVVQMPQTCVSLLSTRTNRQILARNFFSSPGRSYLEIEVMALRRDSGAQCSPLVMMRAVCFAIIPTGEERSTEEHDTPNTYTVGLIDMITTSIAFATLF